MADPLESCKGSKIARKVTRIERRRGKVALVGEQADPESRFRTSPPGKGSVEKVGRSLVRWVLGTILLLSLPTFSDWIPRRSMPEPAGGETVQRASGKAGFVTRSRRATEYGSPLGSGQFRGQGGAFLRNSAAEGELERARLQRRSGPAAEMSARRLPRVRPDHPAAAASARVDRRGSVAAAAALGAVSPELSELDAEYEAMLQAYLPGGGGNWTRNPFADFLFGGGTTGGGSEGSDDGSGGPGGDRGDGSTGGSGGGGGGTPGGGGGGGGGDTGGGGPEPPASPGDDLANRFLMMLPPGSAGEAPQLVPATRSASSFQLDGGGEITLFPGLVGFTRPSLLLDEGEMVVSGPPQPNKGWPYFVFSRATFGTVMRAYLFGGASFRSWLDAFFYYNVAYSMAPFDVDKDGVEELVTTELKSQNLIVYGVETGSLQYEREFALPFRPWYLVRTDVAKPVPTQFLQVFDQKLHRFVTFSSRFPGVYSFSAPPSWIGEKTVRIQATNSEQVREYFVQVYSDRVVFFLVSGEERRFLASVHVSPGSPLVVLGDFRGIGRHAVLILP